MDDDHEHAPASVPRADHIAASICSHGTLHLVLNDEDGEPIAVAPFPVDAVPGLIAMLQEQVDMWLKDQPGAVN